MPTTPSPAPKPSRLSPWTMVGLAAGATAGALLDAIGVCLPLGMLCGYTAGALRR